MRQNLFEVHLSVIRLYSISKQPKTANPYDNNSASGRGARLKTTQPAKPAKTHARKANPPPKAHQKASGDTVFAIIKEAALTLDAAHAKKTPSAMPLLSTEPRQANMARRPAKAATIPASPALLTA